MDWFVPPPAGMHGSNISTRQRRLPGRSRPYRPTGGGSLRLDEAYQMRLDRLSIGRCGAHRCGLLVGSDPKSLDAVADHSGTDRPASALSLPCLWSIHISRRIFAYQEMVNVRPPTRIRCLAGLNGRTGICVAIDDQQTFATIPYNSLTPSLSRSCRRNAGPDGVTFGCAAVS
jgi:hypothetical protein